MNKYIYKLIKEQFNIGNMDLNNNKQKRNMNIFNKKIENPYYKKVLDDTVTEDEIKEMNSWIGITKSKNKNELQKVINFYSKNYPNDSLNWLDVSEITDMSSLFAGTYDEYNQYNGNISYWNTSNVKNMRCMFYDTKNFNQPIGDWDVSNATNMRGMFCGAENFNQDISRWNISDNANINNMFFCCPIQEKYKPIKCR